MSKEIMDMIIEELKSKDLDYGIYDTSLECIKHLPKQHRRQIIFELVKEGRIRIKYMDTNNDDNFPLLIIDCIR